MKKISTCIFLLLAFSYAEAQIGFNNTGILQISSSTDTLYINGSLSNNISGSLVNNGNVYVKGDIVNDQSTNLTGTGIIFINGTSTQNISATSAFNNLRVSKISGTVTLATDINVNGVLNFVSGNIQTGSNAVILSSIGTLTGAAQNTGWINGRLQKYIPTGAVTRVFEVGDAAVYAPVSLAFTSITSAGNIVVNTIGTDHPAILSSVIKPTKSVNRYWNITNTGTVFNSYNATFNFVAADIDPATTTSVFGAGYYDGSVWTMLPTSLRNPTNIRVSGYTSLGSFAIGETFIVLPVSFISINAAGDIDKIEVDWKVANEANIKIYEVERSGNGILFSHLGTTSAIGSTYYKLTDNTPLEGVNFYRIRSESYTGEKSYSPVARINLPLEKGKFGIFPNPVTGPSATLQLSNLPAGNYRAQFFNTSGHLVHTTVLQHNGGTARYVIFSGGLANGKYDIVLSAAGIRLVASMIKE